MVTCFFVYLFVYPDVNTRLILCAGSSNLKFPDLKICDKKYLPLKYLNMVSDIQFFWTACGIFKTFRIEVSHCIFEHIIITHCHLLYYRPAAYKKHMCNLVVQFYNWPKQAIRCRLYITMDTVTLNISIGFPVPSL